MRDEPAATYLWPRWTFLRGLGLIFLSAFYALAFQIHGLIGERGILPATTYLANVREALGLAKGVWYAPTLFWFASGNRALTVVIAVGVVASVLLTLNIWPRLTIALCTLCFLACVAALQDFSSYQSDGMLLEAGFISFWFAPLGMRPKLGAVDPPSRFSLFMLRWEWFRIYFESGIGKLASGDPHWRNLTAMDDYYQNGPLPTWLGWYVQHWPHWYHAGTVILTLVVELLLVWLIWLPRPFRVVCFVIVSALQTGIILTANYAFLNYLVLLLGVLLLDDRVVVYLRGAWKSRRLMTRRGATESTEGGATAVVPVVVRHSRMTSRTRIFDGAEKVALGIALYVTIFTFVPTLPVFGLPARWLAPFRIANAYGLFAVMTEARYEIEFQGSRDGAEWIPYPFRYKPQNVYERPGIYAPYQPRFDWNLWFASLGPWQQSPWVVNAQMRLLEGSPSVLKLFRSDPFNGRPPALVRTVIYQYWFTDMKAKRATEAWWRRELIGPYTGTVSNPR